MQVLHIQHNNYNKIIIMVHSKPWLACSADRGSYLWLWRILDFLNVLYTIQQLGNRTLPRVRAEPWMVNIRQCVQQKLPVAGFVGECLRQYITAYIRTFRKSYIQNPEQIRAPICTACLTSPPKCTITNT